LKWVVLLLSPPGGARFQSGHSHRSPYEKSEKKKKHKETLTEKLGGSKRTEGHCEVAAMRNHTEEENLTEEFKARNNIQNTPSGTLGGARRNCKGKSEKKGGTKKKIGKRGEEGLQFGGKLGRKEEVG